MKINLKKIVALLLVVALTATFSVSFAEYHSPEHGKTDTNRSLIVDHSHVSDGYIFVKGPKSPDKKLKISVSFNGKAKIHYNLNQDGEEEILPLQYGNGKYTVALYQQLSGTKYEKIGELSFNANMKDERSYMLYPNQMVDYNATTEAILYADELCAGTTDEYEIVMAVYDFMKKNFSYDWFKSGDVRAGVLKEILPDIDGSWETRTGICQDLAAIMVAMLRSQGIHARLTIGTCGETPHAWVTVYYYGEDGKLTSLSLDPTYFRTVSKRAGYKVERYY